MIDHIKPLIICILMAVLFRLGYDTYSINKSVKQIEKVITEQFRME